MRTPVTQPAPGFKGLRGGDNTSVNLGQATPPDPTGAVANGQYLEAVNTVFAVFCADPTLDCYGHRLTPAHKISDIFSGTGKPCSTHNDGDPIVLYDEDENRFLISQFALNLKANVYYQCIAVSKTGTPADGTWWAYAFRYPRDVLNDYPKFGVWPDAYYASFNQFKQTLGGGFAWAGGGAIAYERSQMLVGGVARQVYENLFPIRDDLGSMLPADWDGSSSPPANAPNIYAMVDADEWSRWPDQVELWAFHVDWAPTTATGTFTKIKNLKIPKFNPWICGAGRFRCVPQKGVGTLLDTLNDRLMNRLQYWTNGVDQYLVTDHSIRSPFGTAAVRWYQFQAPFGGSWSVSQAGTFAPNARYRWMGSAAMNVKDELAIGFSVSSQRTYPGIGVAAHLSSDGPGVMSASSSVFAGSGSESKFGRWGDYTTMSLDPGDGCTFWYVNEYYRTTSVYNWGTFIQPFQASPCP